MLFFILVLQVIGCLLAQPWTQSPTQTAPEARYLHQAAAVNGNMYMFGGLIGPVNGKYQAIGDTWSWNNTTQWTKMSFTGPTPPARAYATLTKITDTKLLLFGGQKQGYPTFMMDTWLLDTEAKTWTNMKPDTSPIARSFHAATYADGEVWVFGGEALVPGGVLNDVWTYNHTTNNWTVIFPQSSSPAFPAPRQGSKMVTAGSSTIIMYGGRGGEISEGGYNDAWELDTRTVKWMPINITGTAGPKRYSHSMVWSATSYGAYVFGGAYIQQGKPDQFYDDVWKLAPTGFGSNKPWRWALATAGDKNPTPGTPWKRKGQITAQVGDNHFVMFGGYGLFQGLKQDTWVYNEYGS